MRKSREKREKSDQELSQTWTMTGLCSEEMAECRLQFTHLVQTGHGEEKPKDKERTAHKKGSRYWHKSKGKGRRELLRGPGRPWP